MLIEAWAHNNAPLPRRADLVGRDKLLHANLIWYDIVDQSFIMTDYT